MSIDKEHNAELRRRMRQRLAASGTDRDRLIEIMAKGMWDRIFGEFVDWSDPSIVEVHRNVQRDNARAAIAAAEAAGFLIGASDDGR